MNSLWKLFARRFGCALALTLVPLLLSSAGCDSNQGLLPFSLGFGTEVVGRLVEVDDDRDLDGGVDLTLKTGMRSREIVRVPSSFRGPPVETIRAMHRVVDLAKIGDRIRARGTRNDSGVLNAETLEILPP